MGNAQAFVIRNIIVRTVNLIYTTIKFLIDSLVGLVVSMSDY